MQDSLFGYPVIEVEGLHAAAYPLIDVLYRFHGEYELEPQTDKDGHIFYVAKRVDEGQLDG